MTPLAFCHWLQGYFEIAQNGTDPQLPGSGVGLTPSQCDILKRKLSLALSADMEGDECSRSY